MAYVYTPLGKFRMALSPDRCAASVSRGRWYPKQCSRKWTVEENGHKWCKTHAPSNEKARQAEAERRFRERMNNSPAVRLGQEASRRRELEQAIDDFFHVRIGMDELMRIRNKGVQ